MTKPREEIMKDSEVYLRAAKDADAGDVGFFGLLDKYSPDKLLRTELKFHRLFFGINASQPKKVRVLALCFMAAMAKSEGR